jgi:hypothetical protein
LSRLERVLVIAGLIALGLNVARADDEPGLPQLWVDHAVAAADHVAEGTYEGGTLTVASELKGLLGTRVVAVQRGDVELSKDDLARDAIHPGGHGVFFLQDRSAQEGELVNRLIGWRGPSGVAWIRSDVYLYRPSAEDPDRLGPQRVCTERAFREALARAFARNKQLQEAVAIVDTAVRIEKLGAIVLSSREAPPEVMRELGPDPFSERALVAVAECGPRALDALGELRAHAPQPWIRVNAIRLFGSVVGVGREAARRIEGIAADPGASEEEVVAAVDMLFDREASLELLERLSHDRRAPVRRSVAMTLREKVKDLTLLERMTEDEDPSVRERARVSVRAAAHRLGLPDPTKH